MASDDSAALFDVASAPIIKTPRRLEESSADAQGIEPVPATAQLAASFFTRSAPPPLTTSQWLEQWLPAGFRPGSSERGTADDVPEPSAQESPDDLDMEWEPMTPEQVRLRYEEIDAFLAQETETGDLVSSAPVSNLFPEWSFSACLSRDGGFGAIPGIAAIGGQPLRPLQGLREGFAKLA